MRRPDPALLVVLAGVSAALHVGKLPPAVPVLREALGISLVEAGFLLSLVQLAGLLLGLAVGLAADALGLRRTIVTGLALLAVASVAGARADGAAALLVLRAVEGVGFLLASMPAPSLIRRLVAPQRISATLGLWGAYMPVGTALALLAGPAVMQWRGWPAWWLLLGALSLVMAVWVVLAVPPDARAAPTIDSRWPQRLGRTLRAGGPWLVALSFAAYSAQWLAIIGFLPSVYGTLGLPLAWAAPATALAAAVNIVGNVGAGRLLQRGTSARALLLTGFAAMGVASIVVFAPLATAGGPVRAGLQYAAVLCFSACGGLVPGTLFSMAVRLAPGEDTVSTTVGWMQQWSAFGQFAGPPLVAWLATQVGGWQLSWVVTAGCAACGLVLAVAMTRPVPRAAAA